ncbi:hypothetical protein [Ramlibacter lithotrophicus]|nr:hypothetical protein [Ramlibacter lithotrophicus]
MRCIEQGCSTACWPVPRAPRAAQVTTVTVVGVDLLASHIAFG